MGKKINKIREKEMDTWQKERKRMIQKKKSKTNKQKS